MRYPVDAVVITQHFGRSTAGLGYSFHYGLDLAIPIGTPLLSPESGKAVKRGWGFQAGNYLDFRGDSGTLHRFFHLSANDAQIGGQYAEGAIIGRTGNSGLSTGPHLHWETIVNGKQVDPLWWLGQTGGTMSEAEMYEVAVTMARNFRNHAYGQGAAHPDADADARAIMDEYRRNGKRFDWAMGSYLTHQITGPDWPQYWAKKF